MLEPEALRQFQICLDKSGRSGLLRLAPRSYDDPILTRGDIMQGILTLIGIIATLAFAFSPDIRYKVLNEVRVAALKKIDKGLTPSLPLVEKYNGGKSSLFRKLPPEELASSLK